MILAIFGGTFLDNSSGHFDPINYFFGAGIATNIGASLIWGFLAGLLGMVVARKVKAEWAKHVAHSEWMAVHLAALHRKRVGEPSPHPHFDLPAGEPIRPETTLHLDHPEDAK